MVMFMARRARSLRRDGPGVPGVTQEEALVPLRVNGKRMCWPYPEELRPRKARVPRYGDDDRVYSTLSRAR